VRAEFSAHIEGKFDDAEALDRACAALNRLAKRYGLFLHFEHEDRGAAAPAEEGRDG